MNKICTGALVIFALLASPALASDEWRFDSYASSDDCGDVSALTEDEQIGLTRAANIYRVLTMTGTREEKDEKAHWMVLVVAETPMGQALDFDKGQCRSKAVLQLQDGREYQGMMECRDNRNYGEHASRSYRILFEPASAVNEMRFDGLGDRMSGHLSYPEYGEKPRPFGGWAIYIEKD